MDIIHSHAIGLLHQFDFDLLLYVGTHTPSLQAFVDSNVASNDRANVSVRVVSIDWNYAVGRDPFSKSTFDVMLITRRDNHSKVPDVFGDKFFKPLYGLRSLIRLIKCVNNNFHKTCFTQQSHKSFFQLRDCELLAASFARLEKPSKMVSGWLTLFVELRSQRADQLVM